MRPELFTRNEAFNEGISRAALDSQVRRGQVQRLARAVYAATQPPDRDARWRRDLAAVAARSEATVAVAGVAAALLHGFDGFELAYYDERPLHFVTSWTSHVRHPGARRSRVFDPGRVTAIDDLAILDEVATIASLGHDVDDIELEIALESMLRGEDPTQPYNWHVERLAALHELLAAHPRAAGHAALRRVLARRGVVVPTGSAAETRLAIGLRTQRVRLARQVEIRVFDRRGRLIHTFWFDFGDVARRLGVEVDGLVGHGGPDKIRRDYWRDNVLNSVFTVVRFSGTDVRRDLPRIVADLRRRTSELPAIAGAFVTERGIRVVPTERGADIFDPAL